MKLETARNHVDALLHGYLLEDASHEDITSDLFETHGLQTFEVRVRARAFVACLPEALRTFELMGVEVLDQRPDGAWYEAGTAVATIQGDPWEVLRAERVALNILGRSCGVATQARTLVESLAKTCQTTRIAGTRKTTPGFRYFEKRALQLSGADPHRYDLEDEGMIKDNHREIEPDLELLIHRFQQLHPGKTLTVEVESLQDALLATEAGTDWILIDNQTPETALAWAEACWERRPELKVEVSGGIQPDQLEAYGFADRISMGALTHKVHSIDVGLDRVENPDSQVVVNLA